MGTCSCLSKSNGADREFEKNFTPLDPAKLRELAAKVDQRKVTRIQANYRGYKARQQTYKLKLDLYKDKVIEQLHAFAQSMTHSTIHRTLPPFKYEEDEENDADFYNRVFKPATDLAGGGVYVGEW